MPRSQHVAQGQSGGEPLLLIAQRRIGLRKAIRVLGFMAEWDHARSKMRRDTITVEEYRAWWKESQRTAYRRQEEFRAAFPGEKTPDRLLDVAAHQWAERDGLAGLGRVVIPA